MKKARYTSVLFVLILLSALMHLPQGQAIIPQQQTISITDTHDDRFITEAGIGIDAWLCHILDPTMDITSYLVFRELDINWWEPLTNATLRFRTTVTLDFEADSSVTIYGMKFSNLQDEGIINPSFVLSVPLTSAYVTVNTSQFYGQQWHEVNVTSIVEELIRSHVWDGDGHAGVETGDSIGFVILGAEGYDTRWFIDYYYGTPSLAPQLVIHWNHEVPPPVDMPDYAEYNETLGNYTIWFKYTSNLIDMAYWDGSNEQYMEVNTNSSDVEISGVTSQGNKPASYQIIRGPGDDIFYLGRVGTNQTLFHSYDDGETWDNYTLNDQYAELIGNSNKDGSLGFDSSGDLWIVWASKTLAYPLGKYRVVCTNVTIIEHVLTFNDDVEYIPPYEAGSPYEQDRPSLWIDNNDRKHLGHDGFHAGWDCIFYTYKDDGAWTGQVVLKGPSTGRQYIYANIVTSLNGTFKVVVHNVDSIEISFHYYKTAWTSIGVAPGLSDDRGAHVVYNDNEDKVLMVFEDSGNIYSQLFNFADTTLGGLVNTGRDGLYPDLTFDINSNQALMVYDAGADGIEGIIYDFDTESWGTHFSIRDTNPGYIHTVSLATIDIGGTGDPDIDWYVHETDVCTVTGPFDDLDDAEDWIETEDPDPEDPDPGGEWSTGPGGETGAFTRFRMRLWFLIIGFGCLFGPILFFAWRRPSGYYILCGAILMLMGIGMLLSIGQV